MKKNSKLESIGASKFALSESDTTSVIGGAAGTDYSRDYFTTYVNGESLADSKVIDICIVFR